MKDEAIQQSFQYEDKDMQVDFEVPQNDDQIEMEVEDSDPEDQYLGDYTMEIGNILLEEHIPRKILDYSLDNESIYYLVAW